MRAVPASRLAAGGGGDAGTAGGRSQFRAISFWGDSLFTSAWTVDERLVVFIIVHVGENVEDSFT